MIFYHLNIEITDEVIKLLDNQHGLRSRSGFTIERILKQSVGIYTEFNLYYGNKEIYYGPPPSQIDTTCDQVVECTLQEFLDAYFADHIQYCSFDLDEEGL